MGHQPNDVGSAGVTPGSSSPPRSRARRPTALAAGLTVLGIALLGSQPWLGVGFVVTGAASAAAAAVVAIRARRGS
jgi:hypothetical protein